MTNVPDRVRNLWKELYILFDKNFLMDVSNQENWDRFWEEGVEIVKRYNEIPGIIDMLSVISTMISTMAAGREKYGDGDLQQTGE